MSMLIEKFWALVSIGRDDECWEWKASKVNKNKSGKGYGQFSVGGARVVSAHRFSYEIENGTIPDGMCVLHKCDNPSCCNPKHLTIGSNLENTKDRNEKGRTAKGESVGSAKLTENQVLEIFNMNGSIRKIAPLFGISKSQVLAIKHKKKWAHLHKNTEALK